MYCPIYNGLCCYAPGKRIGLPLIIAPHPPPPPLPSITAAAYSSVFLYTGVNDF